MSETLTFEEALRLWEKKYLPPESLWPHLTDKELDLSALEDPAKRDQAVDHLSRCRLCSERYRSQQLKAEASPLLAMWDIALLKAAAGEQQTYPLTIISEKKIYKIEIMRSTTGGDDGLVVLSILDPELAARHEGVELWIKDNRDQSLLRGIITNGEVWQKVPQLDVFDYGELLVYIVNDQEPTPLPK